MNNKAKAKRKSNLRRSTKDKFAVVLEAIQSDFNVFGEKLDFVDKRLSGKLDALADSSSVIQKKILLVEMEVKSVKDEIHDIKRKLDDKHDLKRLKELEKRVRRLETLLTK